MEHRRHTPRQRCRPTPPNSCRSAPDPTTRAGARSAASAGCSPVSWCSARWCSSAATLGVIETRSDGPGQRVASQPPAPPSDLSWKTVDGTVLYAAEAFTTADGVTYALSTAPGSKPSGTGVDPQELYCLAATVSRGRIPRWATSRG